MKIEQKTYNIKKNEKKEENREPSFYSRLFKLVTSPQFIKQGIKFAIVGAIGTFVNLSILYILTDIGRILYLISETIAFIVAVLNNYIFNKVYTFEEDVKERIFNKGFKFSIICVIALIVNLTVLFILVEIFSIFYLLAEIFAICCAFFINFIGNRFWTFRKQIIEINQKMQIKKYYVEFIMGFWLLTLSLIEIILGLITNDFIFILLGLPLFIVSFIIFSRLLIKKLK